jgi:hypothetical protein
MRARTINYALPFETRGGTDYKDDWYRRLHALADPVGYFFHFPLWGVEGLHMPRLPGATPNYDGYGNLWGYSRGESDPNNYDVQDVREVLMNHPDREKWFKHAWDVARGVSVLMTGYEPPGYLPALLFPLDGESFLTRNDPALAAAAAGWGPEWESLRDAAHKKQIADVAAWEARWERIQKKLALLPPPTVPPSFHPALTEESVKEWAKAHGYTLRKKPEPERPHPRAVLNAAFHTPGEGEVTGEAHERGRVLERVLEVLEGSVESPPGNLHTGELAELFAFPAGDYKGPHQDLHKYSGLGRRQLLEEPRGDNVLFMGRCFARWSGHV